MQAEYTDGVNDYLGEDAIYKTMFSFYLGERMPQRYKFKEGKEMHKERLDAPVKINERLMLDIARNYDESTQ